jgi:hypothetical protein
MEKHINVIAALNIGLSLLRIIVVGVVFAILHFVGDFVDEKEAELILSIVANIMIVVVLVLSLPGLIAGIALFKRKEWGRILTLIVSVLNLVDIPLGTAVGAYSIWALVQTETVEIFKKPKDQQQ